MVEETTAAVRNLSNETIELSTLVSKYKTSGGDDDKLRRDLKRVTPHEIQPHARPHAA